MMDAFHMLTKDIFARKSHQAFGAWSPSFFLHYFRMADINMSHPVKGIGKLTVACRTPEKIIDNDKIVN